MHRTQIENGETIVDISPFQQIDRIFSSDPEVCTARYYRTVFIPLSFKGINMF